MAPRPQLMRPREAALASDPEFFERPPPPGRSRESTISLRADGQWMHEGAPMEHARLQRAMFAWVDTHPTNGRFILCNGFDWSYLTVEHTAFFVDSVAETGSGLEGHLSNGLWVPLRGDRIASAPDEGLYLEFGWADAQSPSDVRHDDASMKVPERFWAKFTRHAALALGEHLREPSQGNGDTDAQAGAASVELAGVRLRQLEHIPPARGAPV